MSASIKPKQVTLEEQTFGPPQIDPTARVHADAMVSAGVVIGPYAVIGPRVELGKGVVVGSHTVIERNTKVGALTRIGPHAVIGGDPQDIKYRGQESFLKIGQRCRIREFVTINRGSHEGSTTVVGDDCLLMAYVHIAHDCQVGEGVIMANNATLAGHCVVEDRAVIGGMAVAHQFVRIGELAMVGGTSGLMQDVPPYMLAFGKAPARIVSVNNVGLRRNGVSRSDRQLIRTAFRILFLEGHSVSEALRLIEELDPNNPYLGHLVEFVRQSRRGICSGRRPNGVGDDPYDELTASLPAT